MKLDINADAAVVFANKLEKLHRAALPNAVRNTLSKVALDVKKNTMPKTASETFTERRKNFFKAKSKVQFAKGWNINQMESKVGFVDGHKNQAVEDLEKQERGGQIDGRTFIPLNQSRISGSNKKTVRAKYRIKNIRAIDKINSKKDFHRVVHRVGVGGFVIYRKIVFEIKSLAKRGKIKLIPVFSFQKGRSVSVRSTGFMERSSRMSSNKMTRIFEVQAKDQIKKFTK